MAELGGEDFLGNVADGLAELAEALGSCEQVTEDKDFPFIADEGESGFYRAGWEFLGGRWG